MIRFAPPRAAAIAIGSLALLAPGSVFAEEPVETAIREWVSALDASPQWVAGFGDLTYDATTQTATLRSLSIRSEQVTAPPGGKLEVTFDRIDIVGFQQAADGAMSFQDIRLGETRLVANADLGQTPGTEGSPPVPNAVRIDGTVKSAAAKGLSIPSFASLIIDPSKLASSWARAASLVAKTSFDSFDLQGIAFDQVIGGEKTRSTVAFYSLGSLKDGKMAKATMGAMMQETPSPDGLVTLRIESGEVRDYDLDAIAHVVDPDRYVGGVGDGKWRTAVGLETVRNWSMVVPGAEVRIASFDMEDLKVRQPPLSPAPLLDALLVQPAPSEEERARLALDIVPTAMQLFGMGSMRMSDLDVVAPELERFHLGDFHINDLSSDGLGEIGIGDLDVAVKDQGSFGAERMAIGDFVFPSMDKIAAAIRASAAGIEADPLPLIPTVGFAEAVNVDFVQTGKRLGAVDRARLDLADYIGPVPTSIALDLRGLDMDLSLVDDPQARRMLQGLGYDRLQAEYGFNLRWREVDESVTLENFKLAVKDVGSISADIALSGLKRSTLENPMAIEAALPGLLFNRGRVVVNDQSVVDRAITMQAEKKNQSPEKFREDLAAAMPLTLMMVLKNPGFQQKLAPALQAFIRTPGTMTLTAAPATPVPVLAILMAAQTDPRSLPDLISIDVKTEK